MTTPGVLRAAVAALLVLAVAGCGEGEPGATATEPQVDASEVVDGAVTEIAVDVHERACASARDPEPFLDEPLGDRPLLDGSRWPPALVGQDE